MSDNLTSRLTMTPGHRIFYKLMRITPGMSGMTWEGMDDGMRATYESVAEANPDMVPTEEEIVERDAEVGIRTPRAVRSCDVDPPGVPGGAVD